jgi:hypothetical protein
MRIATLAALALCAALLAAGCGSGGSAESRSDTTPPESGGGTPKQATAPNAPAGSKVVTCDAGAAEVEGLRATAVDCGAAREAMRRWTQTEACALTEGASRGSCSLGGFRCQAVRTDRGVAVSCAHPGGDIAFISTKG